MSTLRIFALLFFASFMPIVASDAELKEQDEIQQLRGYRVDDLVFSHTHPRAWTEAKQAIFPKT